MNQEIKTLSNEPTLTRREITPDLDQKYWEIIWENFKDQDDSRAFNDYFEERLPDWLNQPEKTIPKLINDLSSRNQKRRVGGIDYIGRSTILDHSAFITRSFEENNENDSDIEECYTVTHEISTLNKDYMITNYNVEVFNKDTANILSVSSDGKLKIRSIAKDGKEIQLDDESKNTILIDFFHRAATAQWRQMRRSPIEADLADADALEKAKRLTKLSQKETSWE